MKTSHFWLIRHGETAWNAARRLQGWRDIALNNTGVEQARHLARYLSSPDFTGRVDAVVSSDLSRAHETARVAAGHFGHPVITTPLLRERNFGIYEGHPLVMQDNGRAGLADFDLNEVVFSGVSLRSGTADCKSLSECRPYAASSLAEAVNER